MTFDAVVREHYQPLFRFALSLTRIESDAWDLTQQTFYVFATKGHQLREPARIRSWLFTTLHRAFLVARKRQTRFREESAEDLLLQLAVRPPEICDCPDSSKVLPALAKVDTAYRAAVSLYYLHDCSYNDITAILGVPLGTVKSRIARGIAQLRQLLHPTHTALRLKHDRNPRSRPQQRSILPPSLPDSAFAR